MLNYKKDRLSYSRIILLSLLYDSLSFLCTSILLSFSITKSYAFSASQIKLISLEYCSLSLSLLQPQRFQPFSSFHSPSFFILILIVNFLIFLICNMLFKIYSFGCIYFFYINFLYFTLLISIFQVLV